MNHTIKLGLLLGVLLTTAGCGMVGMGQQEPATLTIYSGRTESLVKPLLEKFATQTGTNIKVRYGDTAELAATILEEGANSPADIFFAQDAGALGAIAKTGRLRKLPEATLKKVDDRFRSPTGEWIGLSGRARVIIYNTTLLKPDDIPQTILGFTDPKWQGKLGWSPVNASFQSFVTAMRLTEGQEGAKAWLEGIKKNQTKSYPNNIAIVDAVGKGELVAGFVNHYYLAQFLKEQGDKFPARNFHLRGGGPGAMINVAGIGVLTTAKHTAEADRFVDFMLGPDAQKYFSEETSEYPLSAGVSPLPHLIPMSQINAPKIDLANLADLEGTLKLLREAGTIAASADRRRPPAVIWIPAGLVAVAMLLPLVYLFVRAAEAGPDLWPLLFRARTAELAARSAALALGVTLATVLIAVPLAWLLVRADLPARRMWAVLAALPLVIPTYVGAFAFIAALAPKGLAQQLLAAPFRLALTLFTYPYVLLTTRAAVRGMDPALEEAARSLGKGPWTVFWRVTLPQLRPSITAGALLVALYTLSDFGVVSLLQYDTFTSAIYVQYRGSFDRTLAAALALLLVAVTALILVLEARVRGRARYHRSTVGAVRPARTVPLGRWKLPALLFAAAVTSLAVVLPFGVLAFWLVRGLLLKVALQPVWQPVWNSVSVSALAAGVTVLAALPIAILSVRYPGRLTSFIERASYAGYALPGIVIALALVFFATRVAGPLYQ
ncbi:MAG: extracellular solute-binding protein, partial [Chloroflexi bacterium]|nr:extracellular solute-binding protein [Chloroflexota bacterium]